MLLVADVGNTNTVLGVFQGAELRVSWRLTSRREQTPDEYGVFIQTLLRSAGIEPRAISAVAISNVVPPVQQTLERMCEQYFGVAPFNVEPAVWSPIPVRVDSPAEVGPDRIVNAVGALARHAPPLIVIDFGTATTFDCVDARGGFVGGAIAPGIITAADALLTRAARLFRVELVRPKDAIGRNTVTNVQSGIVYGYAGLVDGLVARMQAELGGSAVVIATGGLASLIADVTRTIQHVDPDLTLHGLRLIYERARGG
jgi:type III pantothenate kinase